MRTAHTGCITCGLVLVQYVGESKMKRWTIDAEDVVGSFGSSENPAGYQVETRRMCAVRLWRMHSIIAPVRLENLIIKLLA